jgi:hypothetical protein
MSAVDMPDYLEGETFDEMVTRLSVALPLPTAIMCANLRFGFGGDDVDISDAQGDTHGQRAATR